MRPFWIHRLRVERLREAWYWRLAAEAVTEGQRRARKRDAIAQSARVRETLRRARLASG